MPENPADRSRVHQQLKPRRTRVKTGCIPCRLRRKKCDERRPVCSGCERNHLICSQTSTLQASDTVPNEGGGSQGQYAQFPDDRSRTSIRHLLGNEELVAEAPSTAAISRNVNTLSRHVSGIRLLGEALKHGQGTGLSGSPRSSLPETFSTASLREPASRILFEHYFNETAHRLSIIQGSESPCLTCVLPLAQSDSMVMDSVLALSGAHLCYTTNESDIRSASSIHYALALRQLKHELTRVASGEPSDPVRLLLAILLLGYTESISGDSHGAIFHHLRASSHFVHAIIALDLNYVDQEIYAFLLETFAYLASIINITVNTEPTHPAVILDPCNDALERFQSCKVFGFMFGYARSLLTLIPSICKLGHDRLEEKSGSVSFKNIALYKSLQSTIETWRIPDAAARSDIVSNDLSVAAQIYRQAILIFLHTSFYASETKHPQLLILVDASIDKIFPLISDLSPDSSVLTTFLWPSMILGSCLRDPLHREELRNGMLRTPFNMTSILEAVQLLELLWEDPAPDSYGPYGLGNVMKKHGKIYSMS